MRYIMFFLFALLLLSACKEDSQNMQPVETSPPTQAVDLTPPVPTEIVCSQEYNPVCSPNKVTYANECLAKEAGVVNYTQGECPEWDYACTIADQQNKVCTYEYNPVCGSDGDSYSNGCTACSSGVEWYAFGECVPKAEKCPDGPENGAQTVCVALYDPVCGDDGKTYSNICMACGAGLEEYTKGECVRVFDKTCPKTSVKPNIENCPVLFDPVCSEDEKTYTNSCIACASGVISYMDGEC